MDTSSYSHLEIDICLKVEREARTEPPIQAEYLRSGGAMSLIFVEGACNIKAKKSEKEAKTRRKKARKKSIQEQ
jgi:hypothetical protein